ncbi:hypothetical protein BSKO_07930 [Bryopsis sp. KO-2023]|nr:hypothetical protein BSKO_07930 [Bryopsis sp. KO-2023]
MAKSNIVLRGVMFAVWLVLLVICVLAYTGSMGSSIEKVAKKNDSPLTPQGYTFYSFAIIGVLEGIGCLYALFPAGYEGPKKDRWKTKTVNAIGPWWVIGFACQILWLILWVQNVGATFIISLGLQVAGLISFAIAYGLLMKMTSQQSKKKSVSAPSYIFFYIPTVMNLAWLTMASCIGLLAIISHYNKDVDQSDGEHSTWMQVFAVILAALVTFVGLLIEGFHVSIFYGLTLIWTFTGLYIKAEKNKNGDAMMEQALLVCLILLVLISAFSIVVSVFRFFRKADDKEEPLHDSSSSSSSDEEQQAEAAVV